MKPKFILHPSNANSAGGLMEVRAELGWEGYGLAWAILEGIADHDLRIIPGCELRAFRESLNCDRMLFLRVYKVMQTQGLIDVKWMEYDNMFDFHTYSPWIEDQLTDRSFQRIARDFVKRREGGRPGIPKEVRRAVLASGKCAYCGSTEELQVDHIHPFSRGGAHSIENFQPLCKTCNYAKRDKTEAEYFALIGRN